MEKLRNYQQPTMRVVKLKQKCLLLAGSPKDPDGPPNSRELRSVWKDDEE